MSKDIIIEKIAAEVRNAGYDVNVQKTKKQGDEVYTGLAIKNPDSPISPVIYVDCMADEVKNGKRSVQDVVEEIVSTYKNSLEKKLSFDPASFVNYEEVKKRLAFKVLNTSENRGYLEDKVSEERMDLSIVPIYIVKTSGDGDGMATIAIRKEHAEAWGVEHSTIIKDALENAPLVLPESFMSMRDVLQAMIGVEADTFSSEPLFVLSNTEKTDGAAVMFYEGLLEKIREKLKASVLTILPSSIHEVLILNMDGDTEELRNMVAAVNDNEVMPAERLSYNVYKYDGRLSIA